MLPKGRSVTRSIAVANGSIWVGCSVAVISGSIQSPSAGLMVVTQAVRAPSGTHDRAEVRLPRVRAVTAGEPGAAPAELRRAQPAHGRDGARAPRPLLQLRLRAA